MDTTTVLPQIALWIHIKKLETRKFEFGVFSCLFYLGLLKPKSEYD